MGFRRMLTAFLVARYGDRYSGYDWHGEEGVLQVRVDGVPSPVVFDLDRLHREFYVDPGDTLRALAATIDRELREQEPRPQKTPFFPARRRVRFRLRGAVSA